MDGELDGLYLQEQQGVDRDVFRLSGKYELQEGTSRGLERQQTLLLNRTESGLRKQGGFPEIDQGANIYRL